MRFGRLIPVLISVTILSLVIMTTLPSPASAGTIDIEPSSGPVRTTVSVSGSGFTPNTSFTVKCGFGTVKSGVTDASGGFTTTFQVPERPGGQWAITVTTDTPDTSNTKYFTVTPELELGSTSGPVGDQFTVSGSGFRANSSVTIYFDGTVNAGTVTADSNGTFNNLDISVPTSYGGNHTVTGRDTISISPGVSFRILPTIAISPISGSVGDRVTISGTGFARNSDITYSLDGDTVNASATKTSANGSFTTNAFVIPAVERGKHTIEVSDVSHNSASNDFTVGQRIGINPTTGAAGITVTVTGTGFRAKKSVGIKYDSNVVDTDPPEITTDAQGSFTATFKVPLGPTGNHTIEAKDNTSDASATFIATLEAVMSQALNAVAPGHVGMELTLNGSGFKPSAEIKVTQNPDQVTLATGTTDGMGVFSVTFIIPPTKSGPHTITVTDGTNSKQFPVVVEAQAPTMPAPLLPDKDVKAKRPVHFDWKDVNDASGVTYTLQVAPDEKFNTVALEKTELTSSEYTVTKDDNLKSVTKQNPYYWRVKAVDGAFNESQWSAARSFYVSFVLTLPDGSPTLTLPAWIVYAVLLGVLLLSVGVLSFWLARRTARYD